MQTTVSGQNLGRKPRRRARRFERRAFISYFKPKKESDFYGMSYDEKRKKGKAFGRFIKLVKEQLKD